MNKHLFEMLSSNGKLSSKRIITLLAFVLMVMGFVSNLFWDITIEEFIYESMKWIVIGGLGFTASEHFGNKRPRGGNQFGGRGGNQFGGRGGDRYDDDRFKDEDDDDEGFDGDDEGFDEK